MDIQPLPTTPSKTTSVDRDTAALGRNAEAVEDAFESELLSWLASGQLEDGPKPKEPPGLREVAYIEAEAVDEPLFTLEGELAGTPNLLALAGGSAEGETSVGLSLEKSSRAHTTVAPQAQLTEEQLNVRKLVEYLTGLGRAAPAKEAAGPSPSEVQPPSTPPVDVEAAELEAEGAEPELELDPPTPSETVGEAEGEGEAELKLGFSSRSEGGDGRKGFGQHQSQALAEAQAASVQRGEESQLSQASRKMMAELRERFANRTNAKLPLNLVLEEAAVPMRLRFQPGAGGAHEVAFVVSSMRARQELRRLMPEIETVLTELPVEVADVRIEIEPRLQRPAQEKRR